MQKQSTGITLAINSFDIPVLIAIPGSELLEMWVNKQMHTDYIKKNLNKTTDLNMLKGCKNSCWINFIQRKNI